LSVWRRRLADVDAWRVEGGERGHYPDSFRRPPPYVLMEVHGGGRALLSVADVEVDGARVLGYRDDGKFEFTMSMGILDSYTPNLWHPAESIVSGHHCQRGTG